MVHRLEVCVSESKNGSRPSFFLLLMQLGTTVAVFSWIFRVYYGLAITEVVNEAAENNPDLFIGVGTATIVAVLLGAVMLKLQPVAKMKMTMAVVTIYPALGVQLSIEIADGTKENHHREVVNRQFIPRDQIKDCIVYEVILSHKVISQVAFRIYQQGVSDDGYKMDHKVQHSLKLIPAFLKAELTYEECLFMRREIMAKLHLNQ